MPRQGARLRAPEAWKARQKPHKRHSGLELSSQSWTTYNLRFIIAGDLCSAWDTFGGLAAQSTHFGTVLNLAVAENASLAQTYDNKLRAYADELSKFLQKEREITKLLSEEDQRPEREVLRDCNAKEPFVQKTVPSEHGAEGR